MAPAKRAGSTKLVAKHTKKALILTGMKDGRPFSGTEIESTMVAGCERLEAYSKNIRWFAAAATDIAITVKGGQVTVYDMRHECPLTDYAFIQFRNVLFTRDHFQAIALFTKQVGIPFADAEDAIGTPFGKISQMVLFALHGIPVPDTLVVWNCLESRKMAKDMVALPFICKANDGMKGMRNYLVKSWETFDTILQDSGQGGYVVQPFIPNDGDYRVLYIGTQRLIFYRRRGADTHLNNTSQNATGERIAEADCDPAVLSLADRAMRAYNRHIGGVDVLVDSETNEAYILEINATPALLSGLFLDEKSELFVSFVEQQLAKMKENKA